MSVGSLASGIVSALPAIVSSVASSVASGTSARSISNSSIPSGSSMADQLTNAIDQIYRVSERNTARSEAQAAQVQSWQERQNQLAMDFNAAEAAKNRDWQKMMSDTAHQREVADLQAAGLNPILSASGGNGAAVTSGATASGVTSSGAQPDVDKSASAAIAQLLGTMWSAQTALENQRLSAQTNLAIAERNNSTSELVARMYTEQSREASQLAAATQLSTAQISAATSELVARINANASYYSANMAHRNAILQTEAQKVVAQMQVEGAYRNTLVNGLVDLAQTGLNVNATLRGQDMSYQSAENVAKIQSEATRYAADKHLAGQLSSSAIGAVSNGFGSFLRMLPFL